MSRGVCVCVFISSRPHIIITPCSANVLLNKEFRGCLGDFGVARILPNPQASSVAMTTTVVGTLVYMAPEYSKGTVTTAADVYAFGVVGDV